MVLLMVQNIYYELKVSNSPHFFVECSVELTLNLYCKQSYPMAQKFSAFIPLNTFLHGVF